jgi:hypothetical protein
MVAEGRMMTAKGFRLGHHITIEATYRMRLLSWMDGVKANSGIWMENTRLRDPPISELTHPLPSEVVLLAPMD